MATVRDPRNPIKHRPATCPACGSELFRFDGELVCPGCTRFAPALWYKATVAGSAAYVEEDRSLTKLIHACRYEILDVPGPEDMVITEGSRVVCVIRGADGRVVKVRA